jgi:hypothetical protein
LQVAAKSSTQVIITWDESSSATGIKEYVIEMKSGNGEYVEIATPTNASYTVTGLVSGSMYTFRVLAVEGSSSGVVSDWSDELIVTLDEEDHCFIATAAFGSKFIWPVALLRHFRDQYLLTNSWGKTFVNYYYRNSPPVAAVIAKSKPLKLLVRVILAPVIAVVYMICHPLLASAILFSLIILALIYFNFKRRCLRANA